MAERYIWIRNWERFQHYSDRRPPWIKFYVELLDDDTYLGLTEHRALLLHRLWLAFASSRCRLLLDTSSLTRHCFLRVTTADVDSLIHAGYIDIIDSKTLAERLQNAMPRARAQTREKELLRSSSKTGLESRSHERGSSPQKNPVPPACPECEVGGGLHAIDCPTLTNHDPALDW